MKAKMKLKITLPFAALFLLSPQFSLAEEPLKVAIIGAGIGGASTAYFLQKYSRADQQFNTTVFEMGEVGGRLATVKMAGRDYEAGGSVNHPAHKLVRDLVEDLGLKIRDPNPDFLGNWKLSRSTMLSIDNDIIYQTSLWNWLDKIKLALRYGSVTLMNMSSSKKGFVQELKRIYPFLSSGHSANTVHDLVQEMSSQLAKDTDISLLERMLGSGMSKRLADEVAMSAVRTSYGQTPTSVHSFVGLAALLGTDSGLWSVHGGNIRVPEALLASSRARMVNAKVSSVSLRTNGKYDVLFHQLNSNQGKILKPVIRTEDLDSDLSSNEDPAREVGETEMYDIVVIATPLTKDKSSLEIKGLKKNMTFPGRYHRTVATFVHGDLRPEYFGFPANTSAASIPSITANNFFIDPRDPRNSLNLLLPVDYSSKLDNPSYLPSVWKIFSQQPLTKEQLDAMFSRREETQIIDWLANPQYEVKQRKNLGRFLLHDNLYHINSIEWAACLIEFSVIGARNVVNDILAGNVNWESEDTEKYPLQLKLLFYTFAGILLLLVILLWTKLTM